MSRPVDLEGLRELFKDRRPHISVGRITAVSTSSTRSFQKVLVEIYPEKREIVARMAFAGVGPNAGTFHPISVNDMVLVAFAEGDDDQAFIISRLISNDDPMPAAAAAGDTVIRALSGKQTWMTSNLKLILSRGDAVPTENLVLGQVLKALLENVLLKIAEMNTKIADINLKISTHTHTGNLGYPTAPPDTAAQFVTLKDQFDTLKTEIDNLKSSPVSDGLILSDLAFTEK